MADETQEQDKRRAEREEPIYVKAITGLNFEDTGRDQVLLFENDPAHPQGNVMIAGPIPVKAGRTPGVLKLIADRKAEEVSEQEFKDAQPKPPVGLSPDLVGMTADALRLRMGGMQVDDADVRAREEVVATQQKELDARAQELDAREKRLQEAEKKAKPPGAATT